MYIQVIQQFQDPLGSTVISPMGVNGLVPFEGISVSDSRVKADSNCLLQILALSRVSVFKIPFSQRELIPNASFLRDLTKTFSPSHFFGDNRDQRYPYQKRRYWKYASNMHL